MYPFSASVAPLDLANPSSDVQFNIVRPRRTAEPRQLACLALLAASGLKSTLGPSSASSRSLSN